ncbi:MAG: BrnA antitoxin family protein [Deltaproteobacteria bacterium]|nr:BrnA antitoxin family protein [Deltaproteobacteria bacterium]
MNNKPEPDFDRLTRRTLFRKSESETIPGAGRSAAEEPLKHTKVKATLNFDGDVMDYFKKKARKEGRSYQMLINDALREHIRGNNVELLAKMIGERILTDSSFYERLKEQLKIKGD